METRWGALCTARDITEQLRAQQALQQAHDELERSEEQSKAISKGIPVPTYTWRWVGEHQAPYEDLVLVGYNDAAEVIDRGRIADLVGIEASQRDVVRRSCPRRRKKKKKKKKRYDKPILLVEDDQVDAMTVRRSLKDINVTNRLDVAGDGEEALAFLRDPEKERPCIVLLDLSMPRMNGFDLLRVAKQDKVLKQIPVVVLTASNGERDKVESFRLGVAGYMVKPVDYQQFVEVVRTIDLYWTISELPQGG